MQALWNLLSALISNPQLIVVLLVVFGPMVGKIAKSLAEKAALRKAEIALERARIDALRTGGRSERTPDGMVMTGEGLQPSARESLEDLARRRRAELGVGKVEQSTPIGVRNAPREVRLDVPPPTRIQTRAKTVRSPEIATQPLPNTKRAQRQPKPQKQPQQPPARQPQATRPPPVRAAPSPYDINPDVPNRTTKDSAAALSPSQNAALRDDPKISLGSLRSMSRAEWRRAVISQEILSPPACMRL